MVLRALMLALLACGLSVGLMGMAFLDNSHQLEKGGSQRTRTAKFSKFRPLRPIHSLSHTFLAGMILCITP